MPRSIVFATPANAEHVEIEVSHVEARRLIRVHGLPNTNEDGASCHDVGSWSKRGNRYMVHLHT